MPWRVLALASLAAFAGCTRSEPPRGARATDAGLALQISGVPARVFHTHGGPGARVDHATFLVANDDGTAHRLTLDAVDLLADHGVAPCDGVATTLAKTLATRGLHLDASAGEGGSEITIAPRTSSRVTVLFEPVEASYVSCDTYAIRARFAVDGKSLVAVAPLAVEREEPTPRRP
jgi:hypothetical protein